MHQGKIHRRHLERLAFVYLRQSSPKQVKHNRESQERQQRMQEHVQQLGWSPMQIRLLGGDTANSASTVHGRDDYQSILAAVMDQTAGLVAARELSRLVRDNQDWNQLVRLCRHTGVLLCDEYRLYDPADPQDRVLLGIQGAFNEFELAMITDRMVECFRQKAERGELRVPVPPGYVYRHGSQCEKHPDDRVQRAVQEVFQEFPSCVSVHALYERLLLRGFQMPVVRSSDDWREVTWVRPAYYQVLDMLKNPIYAGIYAHGKSKTVTELDEQGHAVKKREILPREQWAVFIEGHHEGYIEKGTWEENMRKIDRNTKRGRPNGRPPSKGPALLAGLLRCRRCGNKLVVHYTKAPPGGVRYICRRGVRQREAPAGNCYGFCGESVDRRIGELILQVIRPAGIEAARVAAEKLVAEHQQQRQLIVDRLDARREAEMRASREYKSTDDSYVTVRRRLAEEWDRCLQAVAAEEQRLADFDAQTPKLPTATQSALLHDLSRDLGAIWFEPTTTWVLKKQIVRTLIEEIIVDVEPSGNEIMLNIHWCGGHHTEARVPRPSRVRKTHSTDARRIIETLRKILSDQSIANVLNRQGIPTWSGMTWTKLRVGYFRKQYSIAAFDPQQKAENGWLTQAEAATKLSISPMSVSRLVKTGFLPAEQPREGLPCVILEHNLTLDVVRNAVRQIQTGKNFPLPSDSTQQNLFKTAERA
jgi:DNA invertase Pin-like site-specific DNA recombinase